MKKKQFAKYIQNTVIFNKNKKETNVNIEPLTIYETCDNKEAIKNLMVSFSSKNIKPFITNKLIKYQDYLDKYKIFHKQISNFYGDLSSETFIKYYEKLKKILEEEEKQKNLSGDINTILEKYSCFKIENNSEIDDKLIIREYNKNYFLIFRRLGNLNIDNFETIAYFTSRFMYSLNSYALKYGHYCDKDRKELYRGMKLFYSSLIAFERAKKKIILFSYFTSTSEDIKLAEAWAGMDDSINLYKTNHKFATVFVIKNRYQKNYISNGIAVSPESAYKNEKEIVFQPFSFYYVRDVEIDTSNYQARIYLETIGKKEILEEQIKKGKEIEYNEKEKLILVKN